MDAKINVTLKDAKINAKTSIVEFYKGDKGETGLGVTEELITQINSDHAQLLEITKEVNAAKGDKETLKLKLIDMENRAAENAAKQYLEASTDNGHMKVENCFNGLTKDIKVKGRTLQNLCSTKQITINNKGSFHTLVVPLYSKNKKYTIVFQSNVDSRNVYIQERKGDLWVSNVSVGVKAGLNNITFTSSDKDFDGLRFAVSSDYEHENFIANDILILEDEPQYIPPYFEGIKSLGEEEDKISILSTGKNLFEAGTMESGYFSPSNGKFSKSSTHISNMSFIKIKPASYILTKTILKNGYIHFYDKDKNWVDCIASGSSQTFRFTVASGICWIRAHNDKIDESSNFEKWQIEEGTTATVYESYKEDKKDILIPVSGGAKGFDNGVADEQFDNGDYLQKVDRVVLNGTEKYGLYGTSKFIETVEKIAKPNTKGISNSLKITGISMSAEKNPVGFSIAGDGRIRIKPFEKDDMSLQEGVDWLKANPVTLYYELAEPILHKATEPTDINLATFKEITHISCLNKIAPSSMPAKFPVNAATTISRLNVENKELEQENNTLKSNQSFIASVLYNILEPMITPEEQKPNENLNKLKEIIGGSYVRESNEEL